LIELKPEHRNLITTVENMVNEICITIFRSKIS